MAKSPPAAILPQLRLADSRHLRLALAVVRAYTISLSATLMPTRFLLKFSERATIGDELTDYFELLGRYLAAEGWDADVIGDPPAYFFRFFGENGDWTCIAQIVTEQERLVFFSVSPQDVPPDRQLAMAELITRLNYGLILGNFEMSMENGDLRFRTSMGLMPELFSEPLLQRVVRTNLAMMDTCLPAIKQVLAGRLTPVRAYTSILD